VCIYLFIISVNVRTNMEKERRCGERQRAKPGGW
jgi:hypothetical protein